MRNFKKTALSVLCFLLIVAAVSVATLGLYYSTELEYYMDSKLRASLAGSIDCLILGSSHAWDGVVPVILDEELQVNSYNLSGGILPMYAKVLMAEKELNRNPIRWVFIDLSPDTMVRDNSRDFNEGDEMILARLDNWKERLDYVFRFLSLDGIMNVYSRALLRGVQSWIALIRGGEGVDYAAKGHVAMPCNDITIPPEELAEVYHMEDLAELMTLYRQENIDDLGRLIALIRQAGAEPVLFNVPTSNWDNWSRDHLEVFDDWAQDFAARQHCPFYNFNLLKARYTLFSDDASFYDIRHLCMDGAETFSRVFCQVMRRALRGEDVSDAFYPDAASMFRDSPYWAQYQALSEEQPKKP